jgi:hypothetical protein
VVYRSDLCNVSSLKLSQSQFHGQTTYLLILPKDNQRIYLSSTTKHSPTHKHTDQPLSIERGLKEHQLQATKHLVPNLTTNPTRTNNTTSEDVSTVFRLQQTAARLCPRLSARTHEWRWWPSVKIHGRWTTSSHASDGWWGYDGRWRKDAHGRCHGRRTWLRRSPRSCWWWKVWGWEAQVLEVWNR